MINKRLTTCSLGCTLFFLVGCKRVGITVPHPVIMESEIAELPLPLLDAEIFDISAVHDRTIIRSNSVFSPAYIQKFYQTEMDRLGWSCTRQWQHDTGELLLLFEQAERRLFIELTPQDDGSVLVIYRTLSAPDEQGMENVLRYRPE